MVLLGDGMAWMWQCATHFLRVCSVELVEISIMAVAVRK